jgi:primosomal replication protein N''
MTSTPAIQPSRVIQGYQKFLTDAIVRSPLRRVVISDQSRLLDCSRLDVVNESLPADLLDAILKKHEAIEIDLRLHAHKPNTVSISCALAGYAGDPTARSDDGARDRVLQSLHSRLDRIRRHAELAKRQTGVHAVWLGYPLLYHSTGEGDDVPWVLAPVFLWPFSIVPDERREGRIRVSRDLGAGPPQINRALASWAERHSQLKLPALDDGDLGSLDWDAIKHHLGVIANTFAVPPEIDLSGPLRSVPTAKSLSGQPGPCVYHAAVVGSFPYKDEAILVDLDALAKTDLSDGVVAAFSQGTRLRAPKEEAPPPEEDRYLVLEADFSQERAIWKARREPGLVIHGPPGTGKSQTIVNIIADALAHDRTVLMVCQKQAATRVVMEQLKSVGLGDLCVEVHQPETDRPAIFRDIRAQVGALPHKAEDAQQARRAQFSRDITALESELDRYAAALHEQHPRFKLSYSQMKDREGRASAEFPSVRSLPELQRTLKECSVEEVDALGRFAANIGRLFRQADALKNPWRFRKPEIKPTAALRDDVGAVLVELAELDARHLEQIARRGMGVDLPDDLADFVETAPEVIGRLRPLAEDQPSEHAELVRRWLRVLHARGSEEHDRQATRCREALALAERVQATSPDPAWTERCRNLTEPAYEDLLDAARVVVGQRGRWWRMLRPSYRWARRLIRQHRPGAVGTAYWEAAGSLRAHLEAHQARVQLARVNERLVPEATFCSAEENHQIQFTRDAGVAFDEAQWLCREGESRHWLDDVFGGTCPIEDPARLRHSLDEVEAGRERALLVRGLREKLEALKSFVQRDALAEPLGLIDAGQTVGKWIEGVRVGLERLPELIALERDRDQRVALQGIILDALEAYERDRQLGKQVPQPPADLPIDSYGRWWEALVRYAAALGWQETCERERPILTSLTPEIHAEKVQRLRDGLKSKRDREAETIRARWLARQIDHRNEPWNIWFALRSGTKNGGSKSLREAVRLSLPRGLLAMRPCWLANPASVSQVFPLEAALFDLVIFDEASQCPIEQAMPAIYRGKSLVVSGDEKQLPPTNFFSVRKQYTDDKDEDAEATDELVDDKAQSDRQLGQDFLINAEDILQAAVALFPYEAQEYLRVHYRSRHPALIEFSNQAFYGGRLETPPATRGGSTWDPPIIYHRANGIYQDRRNREEARAVVSVLKDYWGAEGSSPTVGVVTFNEPQQELIEDLIEEERARDQQFAKRYAQEFARREQNQDVGFFVRNLENVQGDERDVMIFSTTFGPDPQGQFFRRFGPVGQVGGERRLNVAVTRAKERVIVVGSMPIDKVATTLGDAFGPYAQITPSGYLQLYLAYAEEISAGEQPRAEAILRRLPRAGGRAVVSRRGPESAFEEQVLDVLVARGLAVECQVGESGFRIDLAIRHRDPSRGYALGIECDGATYHSDRTARARDVWREDILRNRGWSIHRIWSTRWWSHREQETSRLLDAVEHALSR